MSRIIEQIKKDEGFRSLPYKDSLGFDTVGIGSKLPISKTEMELIYRFRFDDILNYLKNDYYVLEYQRELFPLSEDEAELLLQFRLNNKIAEILNKKPIIITLSQDRQEVIFNMVYQMGTNGVLNFKNMWKGIEKRDYAEASAQMLDSKWHLQTPNRAERLARIMGGIYI